MADITYINRRAEKSEASNSMKPETPKVLLLRAQVAALRHALDVLTIQVQAVVEVIEAIAEVEEHG